MKLGLTRIFRRLTGQPSTEVAASGAVPTAPSASRPSRRQMPGYAVAGDMPVLRRREIIDRQKRLCGYQFSVSYMQPGREMSESLYCEVLQTAGIPGFGERRVALIPVAADQLSHERYTVFNGQQSYLQVDLLHSPLDIDAQMEELRRARAAGRKIALTGVSTSREHLPYLELASMVFLRLDEYPLPQFQKLVRHLRALYPEVALVVDGVGSWPEFRMCIAWGVQYCLGDFITTLDEEETKGEISQSHMVAIEMLNLLRSEADTEELSEVAKKDPAITFKLLGWANSPANGLAATITSLSQAIVILGRVELYRWLTVSMFRIGQQAERNESVLELALARARFLEQLPSNTLRKNQRDELFLVGLFSLFDVLLEVPMAQILEKIHLGPDVTAALKDSSGPYAAYLSMAIMLERGRDSQAAEKAAALALDFNDVQLDSLQSFAWAQEALGNGR